MLSPYYPIYLLPLTLLAENIIMFLEHQAWGYVGKSVIWVGNTPKGKFAIPIEYLP